MGDDDDDDDPAAVIAELERRLDPIADSVDPSTHYDLGRAYADLGLLTEAIEHFERALELDPTHQAASSSLEQARAQLSAPPTRPSALN
jgi:tetratricopeptide (TPR) repeat protein